MTYAQASPTTCCITVLQELYGQHPLQSGRNESYYEAVREDDRLSTKSESDSPAHSNFIRGGKLRSSLPIVRSPNKSLDKPMGE